MSTVVFTGPSLERERVAAVLPRASVEPPAARGDLWRAYEEGFRTLVLIDGAFAHRLAVSPGEVVAALRAGARVIGAASLGAVRAAECHPAGMIGVGAVAALFRFGVLRDDDEVAVAVEAERGHRASSVALVNIRFAVLAGLRRGLLDRSGAARLLEAARATPFSERTWPGCFAAAGFVPGEELLALCRATDVKRRDAQLAVASVAGWGEHNVVLERAPLARTTNDSLCGRSVSLGRGAGPSSTLSPGPGPGGGTRYQGHDRLLGGTAVTLAPGLACWLAGSGRYRLYDGLAADTPPALVWARLEEERELESELMRWHAVDTAAQRLPSVDGGPLAPFLAGARRQTAEAHGFADWRALEAQAPGSLLARARAAAHLLALARRNAGRP